MSGLSPEALAELRAKAKAARPGPWTWTEDGTRQLVSQTAVDSEGEPEIVINDPNVFHWETGEEDKAFIAAVNPAVVVALLDKIEALEKLHEDRDLWGCL